MYEHPYAPQDRPIIGLTATGEEVEASFNPLKQCWVDGDNERVILTHWREKE